MRTTPWIPVLTWVYIGGYVAFVLATATRRDGMAPWNDWLSMPAYLMAGGTLLVAAVRRDDDTRVRVSLGLLGIAWGAPALSYVVAFIPGWDQHPVLEPLSWWLYWAYYPFAVLGMAGLAVFPRGRGPGLRLAIDSALVVIAAVTLQWYFIGRLAQSEGGAWVALRSQGWLFPTELLLTFGAAVLAYRPSSVREGAWPRWLGVGMFLGTVSDFVYAHRRYSVATWPGPSGDIIFALATALVTTGAWFAFRAQPSGRDKPEDRPAGLALLPYLAIACVALLLVPERARGTMSDEATGLVAGGGALLALMVIKHALAQRDVVRAQRDQAAQDARFRALIQRSSDAFLVVGPGERITYASSAFDSLVPEGVARGLPRLAEVIAGGATDLAQAALHGVPQRWQVRSPDGPREVDAVVTDLRHDPSIGGFVVNLRDVTERVRLERQLRDAQKLEVVGRLASSIAHDFNNLLTVVLGNVALAEHQADRTHPQWAAVRGAAERGATLVRQLLSLGRPQRTPPRVIDLAAELVLVERTLRTVLPAGIQITSSLPPSPVPVRIDGVSVEQLMLNLALNARDAMGGTGRLFVRLEVDRTEGAEVARLSVRDTGMGMDAATLARAFEPFFTTKPQHQGTGLGLSTVRSVVREAGGEIAATSAPGAGTTITLTFPLASGEVAPLTTAPRSTSTGEQRRILVVEDERAVRAVVAGFLTASGFTVVEAADGVEALTRLEELGWQVDAVLTDLVMPRMGGAQLIRRIRAHEAGLPVLCMSGNGLPPDDVETATLLSGPILQKPLALDQLARALSALTARADRPSRESATVAAS